MKVVWSVVGPLADSGLSKDANDSRMRESCDRENEPAGLSITTGVLSSGEYTHAPYVYPGSVLWAGSIGLAIGLCVDTEFAGPHQRVGKALPLLGLVEPDLAGINRPSCRAWTIHARSPRCVA